MLCHRALRHLPRISGSTRRHQRLSSYTHQSTGQATSQTHSYCCVPLLHDNTWSTFPTRGSSWYFRTIDSIRDFDHRIMRPVMAEFTSQLCDVCKQALQLAITSMEGRKPVISDKVARHRTKDSLVDSILRQSFHLCRLIIYHFKLHWLKDYSLGSTTGRATGPNTPELIMWREVAPH